MCTDVKNEIDNRLVRWAFWILGIGILCIILSPALLTLSAKWKFFDFSDTGEIGDTIGGLTSPIVGLIGAILLVITIYQQHEESALNQKKYNDDKEEADRERVKERSETEKLRRTDREETQILRLLDRHNQTFLEAVDNLNKISISVSTVHQRDRDKAMEDYRSSGLLSDFKQPFPIFPAQLLTGIQAVLTGFKDNTSDCSQVKQFDFTIGLICYLADELQDSKYEKFQEEVIVVKKKIHMLEETMFRPLIKEMVVAATNYEDDHKDKIYLRDNLLSKYEIITEFIDPEPSGTSSPTN